MDQENWARAKRVIKNTVNEFLLGTLAVLPVIVVVWIVTFLADLLLSAIFGVREYIGNGAATFVAFAGAFALLAYIGHTLTRRRRSLIISVIDYLVGKIPFLNTVYKITQRMVDLFRSKPEDTKREIVYVEYPKDGMWLPAYLTNREGDRCVLFVPTSPNPTNGFTVIVHESRVIKSKLDIAEATSFIVSLGAEYPKSEEALTLPVETGISAAD
ncbi:DUF502 domain-containing protein [Methylomagnum sp.]